MSEMEKRIRSQLLKYFTVNQFVMIDFDPEEITDPLYVGECRGYEMCLAQIAKVELVGLLLTITCKISTLSQKEYQKILSIRFESLSDMVAFNEEWQRNKSIDSWELMENKEAWLLQSVDDMQPVIKKLMTVKASCEKWLEILGSK